MEINRWLCFLLALTFIRGVLYAVIIPPWQAPDEPAHFERVRAALNTAEWQGTVEPPWYADLSESLFRYRFFEFAIPTYEEPPGLPLNQYIDLYHEIYQGNYSNRLAYGLMGLPLWIWETNDLVFQLYLVRLQTVIFNLGIIGLSYALVRKIFPDSPQLYIGVPLLLALSPQHTHLLSTVNNGNLTELLVVGAFYQLISAICAGWTITTMIGLLALSLTAVWTKATAYFLPFTLSIAAGAILLRRYGHRWWFWVGIVLLGALGIWLMPPRFSELLNSAMTKAVNGNFYFEPTYFQSLFISFWAMPGWLQLRLPLLWYWLILSVCLISLAGLLNAGFRRTLLLSKAQRQVLAVLALATVLAIGAQIGWFLLTGSYNYSQGRSSYPVITPIYLFLSLGWINLFPKKWQSIGMTLLITAMALFDGLVLLVYIIPHYYVI